MKKCADQISKVFLYFLIFSIFFAYSNNITVFASNESKPPFKTASKLSHSVQNYTGINWLTQHTVDLTGSLFCKLIFKGKTKFHLEIYNLTDSLSGKFAGFDIFFNEPKFAKIPLGKLEIHSESPLKLNFLSSKHKPKGIEIPILISIKGEIQENNLTEALKSQNIASTLSFLHINLPGLGDQHLHILQPEIKILENRITLKGYLTADGGNKDNSIYVSVSGNPVLKDNRHVFLKDIEVISPDIENPKEFSTFLEKLLNPIFDFGKLDRKNHALRLDSLVISDHKIKYSAKLLLAPKTSSQ